MLGGVSNIMFKPSMLRLNCFPARSSFTFPINPHFAPKLLNPTTVLAAEPPQVATGASISSSRKRALSLSINSIAPFCILTCLKKASSDDAIMSTMAFPIAITSRSRTTGHNPTSFYFKEIKSQFHYKHLHEIKHKIL